MTEVLSDLCELIVDCEHKTAPAVRDGRYPLIRTPDIGVGRLLLHRAQRVSQETYDAWTRRAIPRPGDLILAREAPVGNVGIIPAGVQPVLGQRTVLIRPNSACVDGLYLNYLLSSPGIRARMDAASNGATVAHLNVYDIRSMELPDLPAPPVQRKIAAILSSYDDLIENNNRRIRILEEMAQRIYREWFSDGRHPEQPATGPVHSQPGGLPVGWRVIPLGELLTLEYGRALKADDRSTGNVLVMGSSGPVGVHDVSLVSGPGIVVGRKGNAGSVHWVDEDFYPIDTVFYVRTTWPLLFVFHLLRGHSWVASDTAVPGVSREKAYLDSVVVPPPELADAFAQGIEPMRALIRVISRSNAVLQDSRDLMLPRLLSGDIDIENLQISAAAATA